MGKEYGGAFDDMAVFGRRYQAPVGAGIAERLAAVEDHIRYMEERIEFQAGQADKRLEEKSKTLSDRLAALEMPPEGKME